MALGVTQITRSVVMARNFILKHIAEAERHIADGECRIREHRAFIARLDETGSDTANAELLLDSLIGVQTAHERHLEYLRRLLPS
jgi:hypothetical protein